MGAPIGPGDWVECVKATPGADRYVTVGRLYCVSGYDSDDLDCCSDCGDEDGPALILAGVPIPYEEGAFCVCGFRPIYRPNAELIGDLLRRSKEPLRTETPEPVAALLGVAAQVHPEFREAK